MRIHLIFPYICNYYDFTRLSVQNAVPFAIVWPSNKGGEGHPQLLCLYGVLVASICTNRNLTHDFPIPLNTMFCSIWRHLAGIRMSNNVTSIWPPFWGLMWIYVVVNGTDRNVGLTFPFDFCIHHRPILHRLATIHNAAGDRRQTEWSE